MRTGTFRQWVLGCFLVVASALSAYAAPVTIPFVYRGGAASAVGSVTFESTLISNPGLNNFALPNPAVLGISMTVTGAAAGNGTYTIADFTGVVFDTHGGTLDLSRPLIGQPTSGAPWGTRQDGTAGDLNFFSGGPAPNGVFFFTLAANGGIADAMILVGPLNPIPTLSQWAILVLALLLAGIGIARARRIRS